MSKTKGEHRGHCQSTVLLMQHTIPGSIAAYWISEAGTGVWRKARKPLNCTHGKVRHFIDPGQRYLDTGERIGIWATIKCCERCADSPMAS